ncbi:MAG: hypothetical protein H7222_16655 [Methylotenera sp.]|nr:hypothetical protein [Oligoflexia bacterium]
MKNNFNSIPALIAISVSLTSGLSVQAQSFPDQQGPKIISHTNAEVGAAAGASTAILTRQLHLAIQEGIQTYSSPHIVNVASAPIQPSPEEMQRWLKKASKKIQAHDDVTIRYTLGQAQNRQEWLKRQNASIAEKEAFIENTTDKVKAALARIELKRTTWFRDLVAKGERPAPMVILEKSLGSGEDIAARTKSFASSMIHNGGQVQEISVLSEAASRKVSFLAAGTAVAATATLGSLGKATWDHFNEQSGSSEKISTLQVKSVNEISASRKSHPSSRSTSASIAH